MCIFCIQINTNQGRYVVTSTGDLQIVQVHRSDSGTYVCIADNGIGAPVQREVNLSVAGTVFFLRNHFNFFGFEIMCLQVLTNF